MLCESSSGRPIPLSVPVLAGNERAYVNECLDQSLLAVGPMLPRFEACLKELCGVEHVIACSSGTAGLHVALLLVGVSPGDLVVVPTLTFAATANAVRYVGADPVFVGCDEWLGIDLAAVEGFLRRGCKIRDGRVYHRTSGRRVAALVPVHVHGIPCDMAPLMSLAREFDLPVVEDAAEGVGSFWADGPLAGRHCGSVGDVGVLSFNANKLVTCGGGGAILTDDEAFARQARYLIDQAKTDAVRYVHGGIGFNYRLSALAAAIGLAQLERLDAILEHRVAVARLYAEELHGDGLSMLQPRPGTSPNRWFHSLIVDRPEPVRAREELMNRLQGFGIQTRPLWYPNHLQAAFAGCLAVDVERAGWYWERVLNLPCSSDLSGEEVEWICHVVMEA